MKTKNIEREFTIVVKMNQRWIPEFLSMLDAMERLGKQGSSRKIKFYSDGDGDFRPKFDWDVKGIELNRVTDKNGQIRLSYDAG